MNLIIRKLTKATILLLNVKVIKIRKFLRKKKSQLPVVFGIWDFVFQEN